MHTTRHFLIAQTDKAILVDTGDRDIWVPKSQITFKNAYKQIKFSTRKELLVEFEIDELMLDEDLKTTKPEEHYFQEDLSKGWYEVVNEVLF